jgi:broad specificity phosphatase PhoE
MSRKEYKKSRKNFLSLAPPCAIMQKLMKTIYFVRHGESEGNVGNVHQPGTVSLTEKGRQQANFIAKRLESVSAELIVASTMTRARQTAAAILEKKNLPIEYSDLLVERRRPSELYGKCFDDPEALKMREVINKNFYDPDFHYSDEENFEDMKKRAGEALAYLESRPEENIIVVTHGWFLRYIIAYVVFGSELSSHEAFRFAGKFQTNNTGITVISSDPYGDEASPWAIRTWNDHAHLGEILPQGN